MTTSPPKVGDTVQVPGGMHGTLKFIGPVTAKRGTFAGVQLAPEYAARGKNSGDVDGKYYFKTSVAGSGIFLPIEKAVKMEKEKDKAPRTPGGLSNFNQGGRAITPAGSLGALPKPNFSQSVGGRPMSSTGRRDSIPRPTSPLRKVTLSTPTPVGKLTTPKTRPSLGVGKGHGANGLKNIASPAVRQNKFSQSLRQSMVTPSRGKALSPLGPEASFDEEDSTTTPTPAPAPGRSEEERAKSEAETRRLRESLEERDRQLKDQANSITEMEKNLTELQALLPSLVLEPTEKRELDDEELPADVVALRATVREKNDKIKLLTAEFDANRADFRSTIDTLEMASSETERVYEKRVDELLEEVRGLQDRSEDVAGLAESMRQLEELVQELEEGLEDARRGEAEARGEVEFLRGEVERGRAEVRRLREGVLNGDGEDVEELRALLEQRDDEARGLKAIIQEMNRKNTDPPLDYQSRDLERQITELKTLLSRRTDAEEELRNEVSRLRSNSNGYDKHRSIGTNGSHRLSDRTVIPAWNDTIPGSPERPRLGVVDEDTKSSVTDTSSAALWCEICEEGGHDILTCNNMFSKKRDEDRPKPLSMRKSQEPLAAPEMPLPPPPLPQPQKVEVDENQAGMVAGKSSGVIDAEKWCALCERDGHESVDCPFEDAF